ncbi:MAG: LAS superfamily LD-carboxypeptidase LdcB [Candidatus Azotimanducaceae bacterium]|jgi:LAS superfamily LD-carboxypeptidase LdcB
MQRGSKKYIYTLSALGILLGVFLFATYTYWDRSEKQAAHITELKARIQVLLSEAAEASDALDLANGTIDELASQLDLTSEELDELEDDYRKEKRKNDDFEDQINEIAGTVGTLDKLSKTDKELLQKYSKVYFLNENYTPSNIKQIDEDYILAGKDPQFFHGDALRYLEDMIDEAKDDDVTLKVVSAFRSFDAQQDLKGQYTQVYGSGANTFSADQGYSEHQLGTTLDLTDPTTAGTYTSFAQTEAYEWLLKHAHKFGFILSYPENNGFYIFEPWHWRFVGEDLADDLRDDNKSFYDLDQREIDEYLIKIFD